MSEPEWGDFRALLALGRGQSVAGATRILGVNASTVSRRLAALEKTPDAVLIVRGGREFTFTTRKGESARRQADRPPSAATA